MSEIFKRLALIFVPALIFSLLVYALFSTRESSSTKKNLSNDEMISQEFEYIYKYKDMVKPLRKFLIENKDHINVDNCQGVLEDKGTKKVFNHTTLFYKDIASNIENNDSLVIYYNACSLSFTDDQRVLFVVSTNKLVNILFNYNNAKYFKGLDYTLSNTTNDFKKKYIPLALYLK